MNECTLWGLVQKIKKKNCNRFLNVLFFFNVSEQISSLINFGIWTGTSKPKCSFLLEYMGEDYLWFMFVIKLRLLFV